MGGGGGRRLRNVVTGLMDEGGGSGDESIVSRVAQEGPYPTPVHIRQAVGASVAYGGFVTAPGWLQLPFERSEGPRTPLLGQPVRHLHPRGLDLVNALRSIREDHSDSFKRLEEDFRNEFPFVKDISFPMVPGGRQVLRWKHTGHALPLYLDHFSSGMLAYLCILAAVYAQDSPAWIAFDEPEVHLHPALLRSAVAVLEARAAKTPVLIATHSDALLDFITDPASAVHVVEVAAKKSTIRTLRRESLDAWRTEYRLSELRPRGHLDHLPPRG